MWYNKSVMKILYKNNNLTITDVTDFKLSDIFDCGQCFRWNKQEDGSYTGIAGGKALKIAQTDSEITLYDTSEEDFKNFWYDYFDLGRNYSDVRSSLKSDSTLKNAFDYGSGIRILHQQLWECIVSFII